jgi:adenosylcobinamide-phosphate synthase
MILAPGVDSVGIHPFLLVLLACGLDRLLGDPPGWPHPVVLMGWWISRLGRLAELLGGDRPWALRLGGFAITGLLVGGSGLAGWGLEQLARVWPALGLPLLLVGLASALAGRSLEQAVLAVLAVLPEDVGQKQGGQNQVGPNQGGPKQVVLQPQAPGPELAKPGQLEPQAPEPGAPEPGPLEPARQRLAWFVGRDTAGLDRAGILRAAAESASENAVDGLFGPLFWMLVGSALLLAGHGPANFPAPGGFCGFAGLLAWLDFAPGDGQAVGLGSCALAGPGPLALAWAYKASSTLDSMLGYRRGRLLWLGTAGARLDDLLTWLPCRLVALGLPLAAGQPLNTWRLFRSALADGAADPSPNAGVSQAAYAHAVGVQLGGANRYGGQWRQKPLLAQGQPPADHGAILTILALSRRLEALWLAAALGGAWVCVQ